MKQKKWLIPVCVVSALILISIIALCCMSAGSLSFSKGRCLVASNGSYMIIVDNSPICMSNQTKNDSLFSKIDTGDEILVLHDGVQESYPAGTGVYAVFKLSDGDINSISEGVLDSLSKLGWLDENGLIACGGTSPSELFDINVSHANYCSDADLYARALNSDRMYTDSVEHLPVF